MVVTGFVSRSDWKLELLVLFVTCWIWEEVSFNAVWWHEELRLFVFVFWWWLAFSFRV